MSPAGESIDVGKGEFVVRSNRWVAVTAVCSLAVVGAAFGLGTLVESPWEEAVANSQKDPLVTAPVERRSLTADVAEPEAKYSAGAVLRVPAPVLEFPGVVTKRIVEKGDEVGSGSVLVEVSGRPLIGLETPFRLYRDIRPGDSGPDVKALQDVLSELAMYTGIADGKYGPGTAAAVRELYEDCGYETPSFADLNSETSGGEGDVTLRASEVVQLPKGGATVLSSAPVGAEVGGDAPIGGVDDASMASEDNSGDVVRLRVGQPSAVARVGVASMDAFVEGVEVEVRGVTDQSKAIAGVVQRVSEFQGPGDDSSLPGYDVTIVFEGTPPFADADTVIVESRQDAAIEAEGLAVPIVALREDERGQFMTVVGRGRVGVAVVATGDGFAVVNGDGLSADDVVVISGPTTSGDASGAMADDGR